MAVLLLGVQALGQRLSNLRQSIVPLSSDTVALDSLSLVPGSVYIRVAGDSISPDRFLIDEGKGLLIWKPNERPKASTAAITYRVFPVRFTAPFLHKDPNVIEPDATGAVNPFSYTSIPPGDAVISLRGLDKRGSLSRGVNFGNNQDLSVNSNLNLELSGKLNERVSVAAAISDNNIPIQPEGNTQQLQEFDRVYITLFDRNSSLTAGDFQLDRPNSYFLTYLKRAQGATFQSQFPLSRTDTAKYRMQLRASGAISRGKFARNILQGIEGNQGPYRLRGNQNESFIVVLSGTERVFIDGRLLTRGQENDYVINYNTSELTFTAKQLITKDKRIIVEFQYSDQNYARSLIQFSDEYSSKRLKLRFHLYSEQDGKNQPLQQSLDDTRREVLRNAGDSASLAFAPGVDSADYNSSEILYARIDTVVNNVTYSNVYQFTSDSLVQLYRLSFSEVGQGNGNYLLERSLANGRVYRWVPPDSTGQPAGNFEPVVQLIAPSQNQMLTLGGAYQFSKNTQLSFEGALSNNDQNTFSSNDSEDDQGFALKMNFQNEKRLGKSDSAGWKLVSNAGYEYLSNHFSAIERFRSVEFDRDWNVRNLNLVSEQLVTGAGLELQRAGWGRVSYGLQSFNSSSEYQALRNRLQLQVDRPSTKVNYRVSRMTSDGKRNNSEFFRHNTLAQKKVMNWLVVGYRDDLEDNRIRNPEDDSLLASSYSFWEWELFATKADTTGNNYRVNYTQRYDEAKNNNEVSLATFGESVGISFDLVKNPKSVLRGKSVYRTLTIKNEELTTQTPDNTFLNRLEYSVKLWRNSVTSNSFFEIGSGLEARREFTYIDVPSGQGAYSWTDYNDNGLQELDEFEIAKFQDQANFIKVFTPTDDYVKTFTNQFNQVFFLQPAAVWNNKKGLRKVIAHFSDQIAFRIDRKTNREALESRINPFETAIADTNLLALNSSFRNTFYFNRSHPIFGAELNVQDIRGKTLLTNGFESRSNAFQELRGRWNLNRVLTLQMEMLLGNKVNESDFFATRNYNIDYSAIEPKFTWQPGTSFRGSLRYRYELKDNKEELGNESAVNQTLGADIKYNAVGKGSLTAEMNFVQIKYDGEVNNAVGFEMLDALQPGQNMTWALSYQRTLAQYLQLSLNYNGRSSENTKVIHAGGVQVRAFF